MEKKPANWNVSYNRNGERMSFSFYFAGRPTLSNVVSKIRKQPQVVEFVLPYARPGMTSAELTKSFMFVNGIEAVVFTPFVSSGGDIRS